MQIRDLQEAAKLRFRAPSYYHIYQTTDPATPFPPPSPIAIRRLACVAAIPLHPPSLARQIQYRARLNSAVMVRTLYCFILFPGCLYYMARPTSPSLFTLLPLRAAEGRRIKIKLAAVLYEGLRVGERGCQDLELEGNAWDETKVRLRRFVRFEMCVLSIYLDISTLFVF